METFPLDLSEKDFNQETMFLALIRSRNLKLIESLGGYESLLEVPNYLGNTPLILACEKNSKAVVEFLLARGVFVHTKNHLGETAFFMATKNNNIEIMELLLKKGALVDMKNKDGQTIYDLPLKKRTFEYLEEKLSFFSASSYHRRYPLHYAIIHQNEKGIEANLLLKNVERTDDFGYTPLMLAEKLMDGRTIKKIKAMHSKITVAAFQSKSLK